MLYKQLQVTSDQMSKDKADKRHRSRSSLNPTPKQPQSTTLPRLTHTTQIPPPPQGKKSTKSSMLEQFMSKSDRVSIPEIRVGEFYQKIHVVRAAFLRETSKSPEQLMRQQYPMGMPIELEEDIIMRPELVTQRIEVLVKEQCEFIIEKEGSMTSLYFGETSKQGKRQGYGVHAQYSNSASLSLFSFYQGFHHDGVHTGVGLEWRGNTMYLGQFVNNYPFSHQKGVYLYENGEVYVGGVINNQPNGRGALYQPSPRPSHFYKYQASKMAKDYAQIVLGYWEGGELTTKQQLISEDLNTIMQDSLLTNPDTSLILRNNSLYCGDVKIMYLAQPQKRQFIKQGKGVEYFQNGDAYKGNFLNNRPHGTGHYVWASKDQYLGQFCHGIREGNGEWMSHTGQTFQGEYSSDMRNGIGVYHWPNGNVYEGEFVDDLREGEGSMTWIGGETYVGTWKAGLQHGRGEIKYEVNFGKMSKDVSFDHGLPLPVTIEADERNEETPMRRQSSNQGLKASKKSKSVESPPQLNKSNSSDKKKKLKRDRRVLSEESAPNHNHQISLDHQQKLPRISSKSKPKRSHHRSQQLQVKEKSSTQPSSHQQSTAVGKFFKTNQHLIQAQPRYVDEEFNREQEHPQKMIKRKKELRKAMMRITRDNKGTLGSKAEMGQTLLKPIRWHNLK